MSPALERLHALLVRHSAAYGEMPTYKEAAHVLGYSGENPAAPIRRDLRRLAAAGKIKLRPRGTIPVVLL